MKAKQTEEGSQIEFRLLRDTLRKVEIALNFSIRSSVTLVNLTYVCVTFSTGTDLRNKFLRYWHEVTVLFQYNERE